MTMPQMEEQEQSLGEMVGGLIRTFLRRRWWIIAPAALVPLLAIAVVMVLPDTYESEATLVVVQPRIPTRFVEPTSTGGTAETFLGTSREILSRNQLLKIIDDFGLYPDERAKGATPEKLLGIMRKKIKVEPQDVTRFGEIVSFRISFSAENSELAQNVTNRLATLFIEENFRKRSSQAATTTRFLADQIEAARQRLAEQEQKVRDYKVRNLEQLPQQQQTLLSSATDLRLQLQSVSSSLARVDQQRSSLAMLLANYLGRLQEEREDLLRRFTAKHPSVVKKEQDIQRAEMLRVHLEAGKPGSSGTSNAPGFDDAQLAQLRSQIEANLAEAEGLRREQQRLNAEITKNQTMLRLTPVREQELTDILRDYDLYRKDYSELLSKKLNAELSSTLEERNEGQQFRLVDPATRPPLPTSPKRLKISLGALAGGVVLGFALALLMESRVSCFYSEKEVRKTFSLPMVVAIPSILTPEDEQRQRRRRRLEWAGGLTLFVMVAAAEAFVFLRG